MQNENKIEHIKNLESKLDSVAKKEQYKKAAAGINIVFALVLALNFIFTVIELIGSTNSTIRSVLFYLFIIISSGALLYLFILPLIKSIKLFGKPDYLNIAEKIGRHYPQIKDDLHNALQLIKEKRGKGYSKTLVNAAFHNIYDRTKNLKFNSIVDFSSTKKYFFTSTATIIFSVLIFALVPGMRQSSYRILNYNKEFVEPPKFVININPGNVKITKGDNLTIAATAIGDAPNSIILSTKGIEQTLYEEHEVFPDSLGRFVYSKENVRSSFKYFAASQNISTEIFKVSVVNRPMISSLEVSINPPSYSGLPKAVQKDNGNITALLGSRVKIGIKSNKNLNSGVLAFSDNTEEKLEINKEKAAGSFIVTGNKNYQIKITDVEDNSNINSITYSIRSLVDNYPTIEMVSPNEDIKLNSNTNIPLTTKISDDYGFKRLVLNYKLSSSQFGLPWKEFKANEITISKNKSEQEVFYTWDLEELVLAVNDVVSYFLEIYDNDFISGPKKARTKMFYIRVPSLEEMFTEAETTQKDAEKELVETLEEAEELKREIKRISNELKKDSKEITWEEKEKIEKAAQKFEELGDKVKDIQKKLNEMQKELQENNLLSEETLEQYMELQDLMDELNSDELKKALDKMQQMMKNMNRNLAQKAFEEMEFNEKMFRKSLERTINMLKRIQIEQKIDELVKRTENLMERLEELNKEIENNDLTEKPNNEQMAAKQDQVTENLEKLNEEMKKLKEKMNEFDDMPISDIEKMLEQMKQQQNAKLSEEIKKQIQQQMQMQAMQNQQQLSQNMQSMQQQMKQMKQNMQMKTQMQTMYEMMKAANNLISISKEQEALKEDTRNLSHTSKQMRNHTKKQSEMQRNLDKVVKQMIDLSQKTFAITPEMGKALGTARNEMSQSISAMQNRNSPMAVQKQGGAMKNLNEAASMMKGSMEQMMSGGQGGGMMSMMQQMQQLSQQQMGLNQLTQQLNQGSLSQEQRAQLQRLASEQQMIQKSLAQLNKENKESGQSKKLASNLEKILEEMREVVTNMKTEKLNDDLIQSQERILSKLLDAQRSINERDFEKRRESAEGKIITRDSPPELIFNTDEGKDKLMDELMKAIKEGYSKDYEELIKKYYESLEKNENKN